MAKGNAETLRDILELARTRRLNGIMIIEHKQAGKVEEGEVFFQTGQPIHARIGRLAGQDALNWIMRWHNITYSIGVDESLQSVTKLVKYCFFHSCTNISIPKWFALHQTSCCASTGEWKEFATQ